MSLEQDTCQAIASGAKVASARRASHRRRVVGFRSVGGRRRRPMPFHTNASRDAAFVLSRTTDVRLTTLYEPEKTRRRCLDQPWSNAASAAAARMRAFSRAETGC